MRIEKRFIVQLKHGEINSRRNGFDSSGYFVAGLAPFYLNLAGIKHNMGIGKDAPTFGEAKNSWLTGTAAWNFVAVSQWILGIRAEYDGLRIDPCLPKEWERFEATRKFRGATYQIRVSKPKGICKGVVRVVVNGEKIEGNLIAPHPAGSEVEVEVTLGEDSPRPVRMSSR